MSKVTPEGVISKFAAGFQPLGERAGDLAFGPNGNLYVANPGANAVNEVTPQGKISTFVTGLNNAYGLAFDSAGNLYVSDPEDNTISKVTPQAKISAPSPPGSTDPRAWPSARMGSSTSPTNPTAP